MSRLFVIGLDAFHSDLLEYTDFIAELHEENPSGPLESTFPPVTAPAWASFQCGKNQGKHGVYDFVEYSSDYDMRLIDGRKLCSKTFYEYLDDAGHDCLLYNLPFSLPARIDADIVPSWLDSDSSDPVPEDLYEKYDIEPPRYPELNGTPLENVDELRASVAHNTEQFKSVARTGDHDVLFQLISATDWVQHEGYKALVQRPDSDVANGCKALLEDVDEYIRKLVEMCGDDDTVLLISDHGFKLFDGIFNINDWLEQEGFLVTGATSVKKKDSEMMESSSVNVGAIGRFLARQERLRPILSPIKRIVQSVLSVNFEYTKGINFKKSSAYCLSKDEAAVRFRPDIEGSERASLIEDCHQRLAQEPGLGVRKRQDVYSGPFVEEAGELIVKSERYYASRGPKGAVRIEEAHAHHSSDGIVIAVGDDLEQSATIEDADLIDIAPTVLWLLGHPVPEDMDGNVLESLADEPVEMKAYPDYQLDVTDTDDTTTEDVTDRLENLGYL